MKIIAPYLSCLINSVGMNADNAESEFSQAVAQGYQQIYMLTAKGLFKHHFLRPGKDGAQRFVRVPVKEVPGLKIEEVTPEVRFLPDGKIPIRLLNEVKAFFKEVMRVKGKALEAMIWILWSEERGYHLFVPNQVVSHASARYDWAGVPKDCSIIVDIHSHADFNAFFSGTDNSDDIDSIRFSGVVGHNDKPEPTTVWRFNYFDTKYDVDMGAIFVKEESTVEIPADWIDAVQTNNAGRGKTTPAGYTKDRSTDPYKSFLYQRQGDETNRSKKTGKNETDKLQRRLNLEDALSDPDSSFFQTGDPRKGGTDPQKVFNGFPKRLERNGEQYLDLGYAVIPLPKDSVQTDPDDGLPGEDEASDMYDQAFLAAGLPVDAEDRLHRAAQRQALDDILSDDAERHFRRDETERHFGGDDELKASSIDDFIDVDENDRPPEYDEIAINHGVNAAKAYAIIDLVSVELCNSTSVLHKSIENLFQLVDDESKLAIFRTLYGLLPSDAQDKLSQNGF